jgi:hypothetical protein
MKTGRRLFAALAASVLVGTGAALAAGGPAHAAPVQYANGVASGAGALASYAFGTWTLDSGHGTGGSAQVDLVHPGTAATAPTFTADHEQAGNPRWVIEFHNGDYLFGYPPAGANESALSWVLEPAGTAEPSYAAALAAAQAGGADDQVTAAFIVMDTGNPDTTVHLTNVTYNGNQVVPAPVHVPHPYVYNGHVITVSQHNAVVGWSDSKFGWPSPNHCVRVYVYGFDRPAGQAHIGFTCDNGNPANDVGYLRSLAAGHSVSLFVQPAEGTYGHNWPIPGTDAQAHIDVVTPA